MTTFLVFWFFFLRGMLSLLFIWLLALRNTIGHRLDISGTTFYRSEPQDRFIVLPGSNIRLSRRVLISHFTF